MLPGSADIGILVGTEVNLRSLQPNSGSIDTVLGSDLSPLVVVFCFFKSLAEQLA